MRYIGVDLHKTNFVVCFLNEEDTSSLETFPLSKAGKVLQTSPPDVGLKCRRWRKLWNLKVAVSAVRRKDKELVIVVSSEASDQILSEYAVRRQIETLFGCLKSRGFCLEESHLRDGERLSRLLAIQTLAFCWSLASGKIVCQRKSLKLKNTKEEKNQCFEQALIIYDDS